MNLSFTCIQRRCARALAGPRAAARGHARVLAWAWAVAVCPVLPAAAQTVPAPAEAAPLASVQVRATRDPVDKSYRKMLLGVDRFERDHALAPNAVLRFRLLPRLPGTTLAGVTLHAGARSAVLPFRLLYSGGKETAESLPFCDCQVLLARAYFAPLWDASWPDDTLLEFEPMEDAP